jgi:hypothetical protein
VPWKHSDRKFDSEPLGLAVPNLLQAPRRRNGKSFNVVVAAVVEYFTLNPRIEVPNPLLTPEKKCPGAIVVEGLTFDLRIGYSNPATGTWREKNAKCLMLCW